MQVTSLVLLAALGVSVRGTGPPPPEPPPGILLVDDHLASGAETTEAPGFPWQLGRSEPREQPTVVVPELLATPPDASDDATSESTLCVEAFSFRRDRGHCYAGGEQVLMGHDGHTFVTSSDVEALAHALDETGDGPSARAFAGELEARMFDVLPCATCGYSTAPWFVGGWFDCATCADGAVIVPLYDDCTGACLAADDAGAFAATFGGATIEHSACRSPCADDRTETKRGANAVFPLLGDVVPYYDVPPRGSSAASPPSGPPPPPPPHAAEPPLDAAAADDDNWYSDDGWYDDVDEGLFRQWLEADWPADDDAAAEVLYDIDDHGDDAIWTAFDDDGYPDLIDDDAYYYYYGAYGDDAEVRGDLSSSGATGLALRFEVFVAQVEARVTAAMQALSAARKK